MHWLLSLACVLAPAVYSQQDSGGLVSIWTTEWSAAWGDIQLQQARSSHTQIIKFTLYSFLPPMQRNCARKCWYFQPRVCEMEAINSSAADACFIFCLPGDLCAGRGKGPWSGGILGYGGGRLEGWGCKSALLVFDPGQRYTRGHRTTAAVHLAEAKPPPAPSETTHAVPKNFHLFKIYLFSLTAKYIAKKKKGELQKPRLPSKQGKKENRMQSAQFKWLPWGLLMRNNLSENETCPVFHRAGQNRPELHKSSSPNVTSCLTSLFSCAVKKWVGNAQQGNLDWVSIQMPTCLDAFSVARHCWNIRLIFGKGILKVQAAVGGNKKKRLFFHHKNKRWKKFRSTL